MQQLFKTLLLTVLLLCDASAISWDAPGDSRARDQVKAIASGTKSIANVTIRGHDRSFVLVDLTLSRMMNSSILKGNLVNRTNKSLDEATFEVKAYDREGNLLRGVEEKTIFTASQLEAGGSYPLNSGYGLWLQGIPPDAISRLEVSETNDETDDTLLLQSIPLVSYVVYSEEYSGIEE